MQVLRNQKLVELALGEKIRKRDVRTEDGWVWAGKNFVSPETWASLVSPTGSFKISNSRRRGGVNPLTGLEEAYIGMFIGGRIVYKRSIAEPLGLADESHDFKKQGILPAKRHSNSNRKKTVFPRCGKRRDPGGLQWEATVRTYWQSRMDNFEDYTTDGSEAIGADFKGFDRELQKIVYVEAQPNLHELTPNEYQAVVKAESEGALYVIATRRNWYIITSSGYEPATVYRRK